VEASGEAVRWALLTSAVPPGMPFEPYFAALRREEEVLGPELGRVQAEREANLENEVAACMAEAGFTYYPQVRAGTQADPSWAAAAELEGLWDRLQVPQLGETREDVARHGYGRWQEAAPGVILLTPENEAEVAERLAQDPQLQYLESLSAAALDAYYKTLEGMESNGAGTWSSGAEMWFRGEGDSCRAQAYRKVPDLETDHPMMSDVYEDLLGGLWEVSWQVDNDPRTLALDREWAACMAGRGHDVAEEHGTGDGGGEYVTSGPIQAFYLAVMTGSDGRVADRDLHLDWTLPEDQRSMIQSQPEIDIALADFDCREQTDYMARLVELQRELETAFVADNRPALDEMLAAIDANIASR
jgi:hypothetical protein